MRRGYGSYNMSTFTDEICFKLRCLLKDSVKRNLADEIVWRVKTPIEQGSGTTILPSLFNKKISVEEFEEKRTKYFNEDNVTIRSKEHLFYYEVYRSIWGVPRPPQFSRQALSNVQFKRR